MLLLRKAHLGEVSVTVWPKQLKDDLREEEHPRPRVAHLSGAAPGARAATIRPGHLPFQRPPPSRRDARWCPRSGFEKPAQGRGQDCRRERFLQVQAARAQERRDLVLVAGVTGDEEHRELGIPPAKLTCQLGSTHPRHDDVRQQELEALQAVALDDRERLDAVAAADVTW